MNNLLVLPLILILGACGTTGTNLNPELFTCPEEPPIPEITTDYEFVLWVEDVRTAGDKCRQTLKIIGEQLNAKPE